MRQIFLTVKRSFNARACLILVGLLVPAVFAIQPYTLTITATEYPGFWNLIPGVAINLLLLAALGAIGLWLAGRIGLGMPFIEGWTNREIFWDRLPGVAGISLLTGILLPFILVLDAALSPLLVQITEMQTGRNAAEVINPPAWQGFLAAFSAGITEETMFRLFGLTLLVWLGSLLVRSHTGRPAPWLFWAANILFAILFGLAHLPTASQMGISLYAIVVIRTIIINGVAGVMFGWLYWSFGLESAMLAHISADVVLHGFVPLVTQQANLTRSIIAGMIVALIMVLTIIWSVRAIRRDRKEFSPATDSGSKKMEAGLSRPLA